MGTIAPFLRWRLVNPSVGLPRFRINLSFPLKPDTGEWSIGLEVFWLEVAELNVYPADLKCYLLIRVVPSLPCRMH